MATERRIIKEEAQRQDIEQSKTEIARIALTQYNIIGSLFELTKDPTELLESQMGRDVLGKIRRGKTQEDMNDFVVSSIFEIIERTTTPDPYRLATPREREVWAILSNMTQEKLFKFKVALSRHFPSPSASEFLTNTKKTVIPESPNYGRKQRGPRYRGINLG